MDNIFHEKQEGSLCAQHCLNALLQGPFFTPVDLATLAQRMDDEERLRMAESGVDTEEYRRFIEQPSGNMDDSGYFSVQVISSALEVWGLELVPFNSSEPLSREANAYPENMSAYICNYRDHWFTIRKLGHQWFNLNSLRTKPELISNTYLSIFLAQLQQEGYSIFIVKGCLPECAADELLKINPAVPEVKSSKKETSKNQLDIEVEKSTKSCFGEPMDNDEDLQAAIELSLQEEGVDPSLNRAIQLSLQSSSAKEETPKSHLEDEMNLEVDEDPSLNRAIHLSLQSSSAKGTVDKQCSTSQISPRRPHLSGPSSGDSVDEDQELQGAIKLSLESFASPTKISIQNPIKLPHEDLNSSRRPAQHSLPKPHTPRVVNIPIAVEGRELISRPSSTNGPLSQPGSSVDVEEIRRRRLAFLSNKMSE